MEFLVRFEAVLPATMTGQEREDLRSSERARASELRAEGKLKKLWRVPGRKAVIGLWEATDATVLHDALSSLPNFPYLQGTPVKPLAAHPQEKRVSTE